jgi:hypothetical protein
MCPTRAIRTHLVILGFDTLERVLAPRYYPSEDEMHRLLGIFLSQHGDNARIVCARRTLNGGTSETENLPAVAPYVESGRVAFIDIDRTHMTLSSSALRTSVRTVSRHGRLQPHSRFTNTSSITGYTILFDSRRIQW